MKMSCIEDCCWLVTVMVRKVKKILSGACLRVAITWAGTLDHSQTIGKLEFNIQTKKFHLSKVEIGKK